MIAGGKAKSGRAVTARRADDFYPSEEPEIFYALMDAEIAAGHLDAFPIVWENACGNGDGARVIEHFGKRVIGTDLVQRGYGRGGVDFLQTKSALAPAIITNPPFADLPEKFIRHGLGVLGVGYMALLLKAQYFHTNGRISLWQEYQPAREYKICWRPDFLHLGGGTMDFSWWVWDRRAPKNNTKVFLLRRPWPK